MSSLVIVGAQWGDEGKGKVVDLLTADADAVVRYGGGANAGHTLVVGDEKVVLHLMPSGALHERPRCLLGAGMVLDLEVLASELDVLRARGRLPAQRVVVSERAHLVLPHHRVVDGLREQGASAIGTTKRGIGPCYEDRAARTGLRVADLRDPKHFRLRLQNNIDRWEPVIRKLGGEVPDLDGTASRMLAWGQAIEPWVGNVTRQLHEARQANARILFEGAQGTMLDIDHGTYPFVTSSSVTAAGACSGAGVGPTFIDHVLGITKAYTTRVGDGPFPTELEGDEGDALRAKGEEFGATTGRPRRCGWLDVPVLRHAIDINGIDRLAINKLDVLSGVHPLRICTQYRSPEGHLLDYPPASNLRELVPVYETLEGWDEDVQAIRSFEDLPAPARRYIERIETLVGVRTSLVSVGPERTQTIHRTDPWV